MVHIEPWGTGDVELLRQCVGDPAMMDHLGGPEGPGKIAERQAGYEKPGSRQFKIVDDDTGEGAGWAVIPTFQGRGIASAGTVAAVAAARAERARRFLHAYPSVENAPSNAVCRKAGFVLQAPYEFEYPEGHLMLCNDWRLDLFADR